MSRDEEEIIPALPLRRLGVRSPGPHRGRDGGGRRDRELDIALRASPEVSPRVDAALRRQRDLEAEGPGRRRVSDRRHDVLGQIVLRRLEHHDQALQAVAPSRGGRGGAGEETLRRGQRRRQRRSGDRRERRYFLRRFCRARVFFLFPPPPPLAVDTGNAAFSTEFLGCRIFVGESYPRFEGKRNIAYE